MFRTIQRIDVVVVSVLGIVAAAVAVHDHKVANMVIGLFIVSAMYAIVKAAVAAISNVMLASIEDAYDAGKDEKGRRADVLDLAMHRKS